MRVRLAVEYDGSAYHGWQVQPHRATVQAAIEDALARMFGNAIRVNAAGRTDAGVHALGQVVSFTLDRHVDLEVIRRGLNALTPADIVVRTAAVAADDFDPRRAALSRTYSYRIWNAATPSVFCGRFAWHVRRPLAVEPMREAAQVLLGEHDFSSFRAAGCDAVHPVRRVYRSEVSRRGKLVVYSVEATAYLRHMVRNIVGSLVDVGLGNRTPEDFRRLLAARNRAQAARTAPACGLCLLSVRYPAERASAGYE